MSDEYKTIKCIYLPRYEVELFMDRDGMYCVRYQVHGEDHYSEQISDYQTASYFFDLKHQELEGN